MNEPEPLPDGPTRITPTARQSAATPAHHALCALLWLILPAIGVPGAIVSAVTALLARHGKTKLSNAMALVALVLGITEAVFLWVKVI